MSNVYGHESILERLDEMKPTRALFIGPFSVGKRTTFEWYAKKYQLENIHRVYDVNSEIGLVESQSKFMGQTFFISLNKATKKTTEKLLKILEDSSPNNVFFLSSTYEPSQALKSRTVVFNFNFLDKTSLEKILDKLGHADAMYLASLNMGNVYSTVEVKKANKARVNLVISYINGHDVDKTDSLFKKWTDEDTKYLLILANEVITGINRAFTTDETSVVTKKLAMKILKSVDVYDRPRYVVRSSLVGIAEEMRK